ncbi:branched-chain amino acid ABC transporter permease [Siccirubricoccus sp. G192]|uniref:branched-chain amino acid ABC transporter permease n=1 Tax=Siccirubricoccus sp. G192 TaxID=2849651 RepID=UPI002811E540|nr:branched-chain amino acid ABC transporter permease [Siccirubricoccus sp. G192]
MPAFSCSCWHWPSAAACWPRASAGCCGRRGRIRCGCRPWGSTPIPTGWSPMASPAASGGLAGMLLANATGFVAPSFLAWQRSGDLLFMVILGGLGSPFGAVLGTLAFVLVEEWLGHITEHWRLIFGPLLILAVLFLRGGLVGLPARLRGARRHG